MLMELSRPQWYQRKVGKISGHACFTGFREGFCLQHTKVQEGELLP